MIDHLRIATRKSPLALWQAHYIKQRLEALWPNLTIDLLPLVTTGDKFVKDKLQAIGGKGLFVKELEEALLDKRADLAVHSMKDVPAALPRGLELVSFCTRDNPLDAFITLNPTTLATLPEASVIGTSSLRRQSQLLAKRPDLIIRPLRGNIHTRLQKLKDGFYDAIVLAAAGLERMQLKALPYVLLEPDIMLPACGQGILGIECRADDTQLHHLLEPLNDPLTAACLEVERTINASLGGNCHTPIAIYCAPQEEMLTVTARILSADGCTVIEDTQTGSKTTSALLARRCAQALIDKGVFSLLSPTV